MKMTLLRTFVFVGYVELETLRRLDAEALEGQRGDQWIEDKKEKEILHRTGTI
jgi:hypothetical protein